MGRQQFSQPVNVTSQFSEKLTFLSVQSAAPIAVGATEHLYIYAPAKTVAEIQALNLSFPAVAAATVGTKTSALALSQSGASTITLAQIVGNWNVAQSYASSLPQGYTSVSPATGDWVPALKHVRFDDTMGMRLSCTNSTDQPAIEARYLAITTKNTAVN